MAADVLPKIGFFKKHKIVIIVLSVLFVVVILALAIGLAFGLKTITTIDGEKAPAIFDKIEYVEYGMTPIGDVVFTELECEACTSILNLGSAGITKNFEVIAIVQKINDKDKIDKLVILDANLLITDLVVKSLNRPIMFYGNAKDIRLPNKETLAFFQYFRYDRPFFLNFTEITKGYWKLQCDFISTFIDANSPDMLIQLCICGDNTLESVRANTSDVSPVIKASLLKYHIFAKNAENVIRIEKENSIKSEWVSIVCPSAEICRTSCTICKTTVPDYRNRKNATGSFLELMVSGNAFGHKIPYGPTDILGKIETIPGTGFLVMGDMVLTRVVINSTNMPTMVEIIKDKVTGYESLVPVPIYFVKNGEGMWEWDVDIVYNHLRRKIYIQSSYPKPEDLMAATMTMYYINPGDLPFETADFIRKGFIAQRNNTFLKNAVFTDCACT